MSLRRTIAWSTVVILLMTLGVVVKMAWPQSVLGNKVEIFYDGAWQNISSDVRGTGAEDGEINLSPRGMPDESSGLVTTIGNLSLNNKLGKYSPRNVRSPLYGKLGLNTPIRISTDVTDTHDVFDTFSATGTNGWPNSSSGHVYTSNGGALADYFTTGGEAYHRHTAVSVTHRSELNDLVISDFNTLIRDVTIEALPTGSTTVIAGTRGRHTDTGTFVDGRLLFSTSDTVLVQVRQVVNNVETLASAQVLVPAVTATTPMTMRFQAVGRTIRAKAWASASTEPDDWMVTLDNITHVTPGPIVITSMLGSGITNALPFDIKLSSMRFSLGIILFTGEVTEWPKKWDKTGSDVWVPITVSGITRRLIQGAKPFRSALYRALSRTDLIGYWDFENLTATSYTQIPSALTNGRPLIYSVDSDPDRTTWNGNPNLVGSAALPQTELTVAGEFTYGGAALLAAPNTHNAFSVAYWNHVPIGDDLPVGFTGMRTTIAVANSTAAQWIFTNDTNSVSPGSQRMLAVALNSSGAAIFSTATASVPYISDWRMFRFTIDNSGANIRFRAYIDEVLIGTAVGGVFAAGQPLSVVSFSALPGNPGVADSWGHFAVASGITTDPLADNGAFIYTAGRGHVGDTAIARAQRLADEEGVTLVITQGTVADGEGTLVGVQKQKTFIELLVDTVNADDGLLYELRDQSGYGFKTRVSLYAKSSRLTINYIAAELSEVPETTDDDQRIRNEITATREDSNTSVTVEQTTGPMSTAAPTASPPGVGRYDTEVKSALYADDQLLDYAGLRLMLGTWDESRWPAISVGLHRTQFASNLTQLTSAAFLDIADIFTLVNLPEWLPPDDVILQLRSVSIFLSNFNWGIDWNTLPGGPWAEIGRLENADYGRLDTTGSTLVTAIDDNDTDLIVLTSEDDLPFNTPYWTEDINELNFFDAEGLKLRLNPQTRAGGRGGEQITIGSTFIATDTFTRVAAQLNGTLADTGQTWGTAQGTATDATVNGTAALFVHPAANTILGVQLPIGISDLCTSVDASFSVTTATGAALRAMVYVRTDTTGTNAYHARLELIGSVVTLRLVKTIASVSTAIGTLATMSAANDSAIAWRIKVMVQDRNLYAKAWQPSVDSEPDWQVSAFDGASEYMIATRTALYSQRVVGNTNANATITFDNLTVQSRKITAAYYDRWSRTEVNTLGTADSGGAWTLLQNGGTAADYDVVPNNATTVIGAANTYRAAYLNDINLQDVSASVIWTCPLATGADLYAGNILLRGNTSPAYILCRVYMVPTINTINIEIVAANGSSLGVTPVWGLTHVAATQYRTRAAAMGNQIMMKVWPVSQNEPHYWQLVVTDPAAVVSGWVGWFNGRQSGNTNVNPTPTIANFRVDNPQRITAERGTNGVAVTWPVDTDVRLWNPLRLAR